MLKRILFFCFFIVLGINLVKAHSFTSVYNGKTFFFVITSSSAPYTVDVSFSGTNSSSVTNEYFGDIEIPSSVTFISNDMPTTYAVTGIGSEAFSACTSVTSIIVPNSVTYINAAAFFNCTHLTSITLGNSVSNLSNNIFYGCTRLSNITVNNATPPVITGLTFSSMPSSTVINIPCGSANAYQNIWGTFVSNFAEFGCDTLTINSSNNALGVCAANIANSQWHYSNLTSEIAISGNVNLFAMPKNGSVFHGWSDGNTDNPRTVNVGSDTTFTAVFTGSDLSALALLNHITTLQADSAASHNEITQLRNENIILQNEKSILQSEKTILQIRNEQLLLANEQLQRALEGCENPNILLEVEQELENCETQNSSLQATVDYLLQKLEDCESQSGLEDVSANRIKIYPNPVKDEVFITSEYKVNRVEIYALTGSLLFSENNFSEKISLKNFAQGVYLLKIYTDKGIKIEKVVKE